MLKVKQSSKNITPYGGLNFIYDAVIRKGIPESIDQLLGRRHYLATYSYSDIVMSLLGNALCQGDFIADLAQLKAKFTDQVFTKIPSPDTVEYACQELKSQTIVENTDKGIVHEFNYDNDINSGLVALCVKQGLLSPDFTFHVLDFDNVVIANDKQDARTSYKGTKAYHPSFGFIGRLAVHIENRNGNTPAKYKQAETLERCFKNLKANGVQIGHFRADSASYQEDVVELVSKKAAFFYIRANDCEKFRAICGDVEKWETVIINYQKKEVASISYAPFGGKVGYRVVVTRSPREDKQLDVFSGCAYNYYGIMTNNEAFGEKEIIEFYNERGDSENSNKNLLNDFNLHHLPFMDMDTNTVFMYLMSICNNVFEWVKTILVGNKVGGIEPQMRAKAVCFRYVAVAAQFIDHARARVLQVFSGMKYEVLRI